MWSERRDVRPAETVRRDMRQRRQTPFAHLLSGEHRGLVDDDPDALAAHALGAFVSAAATIYWWPSRRIDWRARFAARQVRMIPRVGVMSGLSWW